MRTTASFVLHALERPVARGGEGHLTPARVNAPAIA
jgi:hypothetical protein